jgi:hypothetical protein
LTKHERQECFDALPAHTVAVLSEADTVQRAEIVSNLVAAPEPPCNEPGNTYEFLALADG